jgi:hypothetical protein
VEANEFIRVFECPESLDERQYSDYNLDNNGLSINTDDQEETK